MTATESVSGAMNDLSLMVTNSLEHMVKNFQDGHQAFGDRYSQGKHEIK